MEAYNLCDEASGSFRDLYARAYEISRDPCFQAPFELPIVADMAKDFVRYRAFDIRYPLGMLRLSNSKLRQAGFRFPVGFDAALELVLARRRELIGDEKPSAAA
jgi:hypothetical protein